MTEALSSNLDQWYAIIDKLHGGMVGLCSSMVNQNNLQMSLVNLLLTYQIAIHPSIPSVLAGKSLSKNIKNRPIEWLEVLRCKNLCTN